MMITWTLQSTPFSFLQHFCKFICEMALSTITRHKTNIDCISFRSWQNYKPSVLSKTILHVYPEAKLRSLWAYSFNHAPQSNQYLYIFHLSHQCMLSTEDSPTTIYKVIFRRMYCGKRLFFGQIHPFWLKVFENIRQNNYKIF